MPLLDSIIIVAFALIAGGIFGFLIGCIYGGNYVEKLWRD
jgi:hypothetical protein